MDDRIATGLHDIGHAADACDLPLERHCERRLRLTAGAPLTPEVMTMVKKLVATLIALAFAPALLAGCNTMQGAGQDISKAGQKVEKEAAQNKKY
jgi:predicted small secreted protein